MPSPDIYERLFETAQTGRLLLEKSTGRIVAANSAFLRIAGRRRSEVVGRNFWAPPLVADADTGSAMHAHLRAGGAVLGAEVPLQAEDGRWLLLEVSGNSVDGMVQVEVRDATPREQARLAERLETLHLLAARTACEFQTAHDVLRAMGELLLIAAGQGRAVLGELEKIQQASQRVGAIAWQLQAFSGGIALQTQKVALNDLVEGTLPRLRQMFGPGVEIISDLSPTMVAVSADPVQVRQMILKLAANSQQAMGRTGTFCLQTGCASAVEPGLGNEGTGGRFGFLAISDNGPGLDDQSWAHLYEPFFSTKANERNLGLGLASVYGMVRQSAGRLWAYSQPGKGATFRIYLPVALPLAEGAFPALPAAEVDRPGRGAAILLVESNDGMRTVMTNLLKRRGFHVLPALHSAEALRIAAAQGAPDLLICRPAPELAGQLARMQPRLRVLYLGGQADGAVAAEHGLPPRTSLLQKPFEPEALLDRVAELLSQPL